MANGRGMGASPPTTGPSAFAGVPTPDLPPLPPPVSSAGPNAAPASPPAPPVPDVGPVPAAPPPAAAPVAPQASAPRGPASFNDARKNSGGGFNAGMLAIPAVLLLLVGGWFVTRGTTTADDLQAGDCFIMPTSDGEFDRLNTEDCAQVHDGQIFASVELDGPDTYPADADAYWQLVFNACAEQADVVLTRIDAIPADAELNFFSPVAAGWERRGDRESLCYIHAPSGLNGDHMG